ncbi:MAG: hypothetical protein ACYTF1_05705 [Planctomycetota bacterium]
MLRRIIWGICGFFLTEGAVLAQYVETKPTVLKKDSTAIEWLIAGIFLVGCMVVAFKPAKRSNLK